MSAALDRMAPVGHKTFDARLGALMGPVAAAAGCVLVAVEPVAGQRLLRLYIEREAGVDCELCAQVSRLVSDWADVHEAELAACQPFLGGAYTLEVSSPGLDRPLVAPEHFQRFVGQLARIETTAPIDTGGRRRLTGRLAGAAEAHALVEADDQVYTIPLDAIRQARLVPSPSTKE